MTRRRLNNAERRIELGNTSTPAAQQASGTTITFSHTTQDRAYRGLVVCIMSTDGTGQSKTINSVTYNGVSMTSITTTRFDCGGSDAILSFWYLASPTIGAANVVITANEAFTSIETGYAVAVELFGVFPGVFDGSSTSADSAGASVSTFSSASFPTTAGTFAIEILGTNANPTVSQTSPGQTLIAEFDFSGVNTAKMVVSYVLCGNVISPNSVPFSSSLSIAEAVGSLIAGFRRL